MEAISESGNNFMFRRSSAQASNHVRFLSKIAPVFSPPPSTKVSASPHQFCIDGTETQHISSTKTQSFAFRAPSPDFLFARPTFFFSMTFTTSLLERIFQRIDKWAPLVLPTRSKIGKTIQEMIKEKGCTSLGWAPTNGKR